MLAFRNICWLGFSFCAILLISAYGLEYYMMIEPCPLCILQRIVFAAIAVLFAISALINPKAVGQIIHSILMGAFALLGLLLAARQVWLQHLPTNEALSCTAGLQRLLQQYPMLDVLALVLKGTQDCAEIQLKILGLSIPSWSLLCFSFLIILSIYIAILQKKLLTKN